MNSNDTSLGCVIFNKMRRLNSKAEKLMQMARRTVETDREAAKELVVLALKQEDAVNALDRLLPRVPEKPDVEEEIEELSQAQVGKIMGLVRELEARDKKRIATAILSKLERMEQNRKKKRKK